MNKARSQGYFARRIEVPSGSPATLLGLPFKALASSSNLAKKVSTVVEYQEIGAHAVRRELLDYPEDPTKPAYALRNHS